jgi:hypothetical protein
MLCCQIAAHEALKVAAANGSAPSTPQQQYKPMQLGPYITIFITLLLID